MKRLILFLSALSISNAIAAPVDVNQLFKDLCTAIPQQAQTAHVTYDHCIENGRFSTEGSISSGFWWGGVVLPDPKGGATFSCAFDIRTDHKYRTYPCERHISQGE